MSPRDREDDRKPSPAARSRDEVQSKAEADEVTGPTPNPGNESDHSDLIKHHPLRSEKLTNSGKGRVVGAEVTEKADGEKVGRVPGQSPSYKSTSTYKYQHVILPVGPEGDVLPGPDSAAVQACIQAGYRPVAEAKVESVEDHPDGVSKVVTWAIPCVEASSDEYRNEGV